MWTDNGRLLESLHAAADAAVAKLPGDATLAAVERTVADALRRCAKGFNNRRPEVVVIAHEADPRAGAAAAASAARRGGAGAREPRPAERRRREGPPAPRRREADALFAGRGGQLESTELGASDTESAGSGAEDGSARARGASGERGAGRARAQRPPAGAARRAGPPPTARLPPGAMQRRQAANPRDAPEGGGNVEYP